MRYKYEVIEDSGIFFSASGRTLLGMGLSWKVRDTLAERTVAFCFFETWAKFIVNAMNLYEGVLHVKESIKLLLIKEE